MRLRRGRQRVVDTLHITLGLGQRRALALVEHNLYVSVESPEKSDSLGRNQHVERRESLPVFGGQFTHYRDVLVGRGKLERARILGVQAHESRRRAADGICEVVFRALQKPTPLRLVEHKRLGQIFRLGEEKIRDIVRRNVRTAHKRLFAKNEFLVALESYFDNLVKRLDSPLERVGGK